MAKINIEIDLDWLNDEGYSIDEEIKERVIKGVKDELLKKSTDEIIKKFDSEIAKKLIESTKVIEQRIDEFIEIITQKQIEKIRIPEKTSSWSNEVNFIPITEFIGKRFEELTTKKIYNGAFEKVRYDSDAKYSMTEKSIKEYLDTTLSTQVSTMVKKAQKEAEDTIIKTLEQTLKENLAIDTINRMNIPKMLESLQQKALEYENITNKEDKNV